MISFLDKNIILLLFSLNYTSILFLLGLCGLLMNSRNVLLMLLSLELTFFASSLNFIMSSVLLQTITGSMYGMLMMLVVVADTSMGLSLIVLMYSNSKTVNVNSLMTLSG